jgi:uncharacterized protein (TIGR00725 family)
MALDRKIQIGVIGAGSCTPEEAQAAYRIGREIALRGAVLVCGGLGGVMEAACMGALSADGVTVGLLPTSRKEDANPYVDIAVVTDMGHARNAIIARSSDVLIAVGGEYGTLSEIALGLKMGKKVVSLKGGWNIKGVLVADGPEHAVDTAFNLLLQ